MDISVGRNVTPLGQVKIEIDGSGRSGIFVFDGGAEGGKCLSEGRAGTVSVYLRCCGVFALGNDAVLRYRSLFSFFSATHAPRHGNVGREAARYIRFARFAYLFGTLVLRLGDVGHQAVEVDFEHGVAFVVAVVAVFGIFGVQTVTDFPVIGHTVVVAVGQRRCAFQFGPGRPVTAGIGRHEIFELVDDAALVGRCTLIGGCPGAALGGETAVDGIATVGAAGIVDDRQETPFGRVLVQQWCLTLFRL